MGSAAFMIFHDLSTCSEALVPIDSWLPPNQWGNLVEELPRDLPWLSFFTQTFGYLWNQDDPKNEAGIYRFYCYSFHVHCTGTCFPPTRRSKEHSVEVQSRYCRQLSHVSLLTQYKLAITFPVYCVARGNS